MPPVTSTALLMAVNQRAIAAPINDPAEIAGRARLERQRIRERWRFARNARLTLFRRQHGLPAAMTAKEVHALMRAAAVRDAQLDPSVA